MSRSARDLGFALALHADQRLHTRFLFEEGEGAVQHGPQGEPANPRPQAELSGAERIYPAFHVHSGSPLPSLAANAGSPSAALRMVILPLVPSTRTRCPVSRRTVA